MIQKILVIFLLAIGLMACNKLPLPGRAENPPAPASQLTAPLPQNPPQATAPTMPALASTLPGTYSASGTNPGGGGRYHGTATITQKGNAYLVHWNVGNVYDGTGTLEGNTFNVKWGSAAAPVGVVNYIIGPDGILRGTWYTYDNPNKLGTEVLTPRK